MKNEAIEANTDLGVSLEILRAFAKGELDAKQEQHVLELLDKHPELAAQVAAISVDSVIVKMRDHSKLASEKSLSSQLADDSPCKTELFSGPSGIDSKIQAELEGLTDFKILKEIGRGGMGVIYLAQHILTGRKEVLKVLNERLMVNHEARKRFEQEIKCIAATNHESIVRCYTVMQLRDTVVLCMEYVPGKNLHQVIAANGPLPIHVASAIAIKICLGLQHAMDHGLVHRDIKPSNIMLSKADGKIKAKILDFGLARLTTCDGSKAGKSVSALTDDGILLGTLEYIAPEQCRDATSADIRSDIYSLGCTLYHMIVGHPPFSGSIGELVLAHTQTVPPAIDRIRPEVPKALADVVAKMLCKEPGDRYGTPMEIAEALIPLAKRELSTDTAPVSDVKRQDSTDTKIEPRHKADTSVVIATRNSNHPVPARSIKRRYRVVGLAVFFLGIVSMLGMQWFITISPTGTIVISDLPKDAVVLVDGHSATVQRAGTQGTVQVKKGEREITVKLTGTTLLKTSISIRRGDMERLQVAVRGESRLDGRPNAGVAPRAMARLPDLTQEFAGSSFESLLGEGGSISDQSILANFETKGVDYRIDAESGTVVLGGSNHSDGVLRTKRGDFRNFHLRIEMMIDSSRMSSRWNQHFVLRANQIGADKIGWRVMLGGHRPHAGVTHQVVPFGLMGILVRPFRGYPDGKIGVPYFKENRLSFFQKAPEYSMPRDEFHVVEYIVYGESIELFLDGRFVCSATDPLNRVARGGIVLAKPSEAIDVFREISILELEEDAAAEQYARAMALALAKD